MATYKFIFNTQTTNMLTVLVDPTSGTTNGKYAFDIISPAGVYISTVNPNFFSNPTTYAHVSTTVATIWTGVSLPLDINGNVLCGKYKFRVVCKQTGNYGDDDKLITEPFQEFTLSKRNAIFSATPNYADYYITFNDLTDYSGCTISSRSIVATPLTGGVPETSNTAQLVTSALKEYSTTLTVDGNKLTTLTSGYSVDDIFRVFEILPQTIDYSNLSDIICNAYKKLAEIDAVICSQNRILTGAEQLLYMRITGKLALIGAALHIPINLECNINKIIEELAELVA